MRAERSRPPPPPHHPLPPPPRAYGGASQGGRTYGAGSGRAAGAPRDAGHSAAPGEEVLTRQQRGASGEPPPRHPKHRYGQVRAGSRLSPAHDGQRSLRHAADTPASSSSRCAVAEPRHRGRGDTPSHAAGVAARHPPPRRALTTPQSSHSLVACPAECPRAPRPPSSSACVRDHGSCSPRRPGKRPPQKARQTAARRPSRDKENGTRGCCRGPTATRPSSASAPAPPRATREKAPRARAGWLPRQSGCGGSSWAAGTSHGHHMNTGGEKGGQVDEETMVLRRTATAPAGGTPAEPPGTVKELSPQRDSVWFELPPPTTHTVTLAGLRPRHLTTDARQSCARLRPGSLGGAARKHVRRAARPPARAPRGDSFIPLNQSAAVGRSGQCGLRGVNPSSSSDPASISDSCLLAERWGNRSPLDRQAAVAPRWVRRRGSTRAHGDPRAAMDYGHGHAKPSAFTARARAPGIPGRAPSAGAPRPHHHHEWIHSHFSTGRNCSAGRRRRRLNRRAPLPRRRQRRPRAPAAATRRRR